MKKTEESVALGKRIRQVRSEQGLNQAEFAKAIGSSRDTIARSEIGNQNPNEKVLRQICKAFNTNFMWLLTGDLEHHGKESYDKLTEESNRQKQVILEQKATISALERTITILASQLRGSDERSAD
jgi:transcriptional regulator with XRE-family HTH domain